MTDTAAAEVARLRSHFAGRVLEPGAEGYEEARSIWNGAINRHPAVIAQCTSTADVVEAIRFARAAGLELSVRGGGHNFSGCALVDGGLTVDLSPMHAVSVDPARRRARCGGGTTWGVYDAVCQEHGLASPGGFITHTGVAGLTLGGGMGWLSRMAGLAADNLTGAQVVTATGEVVRAAADENSELFWGLRGGGGNFGVVTEFEFALHQVGLLNLQLWFFGLDDGAAVMMAADQLADDLPDDVTMFLGGLNAPPEPFVPEQYQLQPGYAMLLLGTGTAESHAAVTSRVKGMFPAPLFDFATPIPYTALQSMFDASSPWGILGYERALHLERMTPGAAQVIADHMPRKTSPMSFVPIFVHGGAYARVPDADTAFGGSRSSRYVVNVSAVAPAPDLFEADKQWVKDFWTALLPHAKGAGSYVNFMSEYEEDRVRASYGAAKYDRLAALKRTWDPDNVFHLNANIRP
ncbi:MAG TPA: FAD-binding oxidoreductase [Acidimicrobiales bacterium]|nr:FAD-binding oxidoreductase [Acidimicrobiales bacterium]